MLYNKIKKIKAILFDVDGVLADGKIVHSANGDELKFFNVMDGLGITMLRMAGIKTGIITGRKGAVIEKRFKELKMDFLSMGQFSKLEPLKEFMDENGLAFEEIAYMGDDILDLPILSRVGFAAAPANLCEEIKPYCDYVTKAEGGNGAVRELIDLVLKTQEKFEDIFQKLANLPEDNG